MAKKVDMRGRWQAFILFDPTTEQRIGVYASKAEAGEDCPNWRDEGYALMPCEIELVKVHR